MMPSDRDDAGRVADRQAWMGALATAPAERLNSLWNAIPDKPNFTFLRPPEIGLVMARGKTGGSGQPFNFGEVTVTRCSLRLASGTVGHAYLAGRDRRKAEQAALLDALLQEPGTQADIMRKVITPLMQERAQRDTARAAKVAATKVDFFTMVRGEN